MNFKEEALLSYYEILLQHLEVKTPVSYLFLRIVFKNRFMMFCEIKVC